MYQWQEIFNMLAIEDPLNPGTGFYPGVLYCDTWAVMFDLSHWLWTLFYTENWIPFVTIEDQQQ